MPHPDSFNELPPIGAVLYGAVSADEVRFFPKLRWKGFRVTPVYWYRDSSEPLLHCRMETHELGAKSEREHERLVEDIRTQGWHWDLREGGHKYIHVDDLEKIEGPAPDGPF